MTNEQAWEDWAESVRENLSHLNADPLTAAHPATKPRHKA